MRALILPLALAASLTWPAASAFARPHLVDDDFPITTFECYDCHVGPLGGDGCDLSSHPQIPCLNPFGRAFFEAGDYTAALSSGDQDGDGTSNDAELTAARSAGLSAGAESVGCDMDAAARQPGVYLSCGTGGSTNVEVRANFASSPRPNYGFSFRCVTGSAPEPTSGDPNWVDNCLDPPECLGGPCGTGTCVELALGPSWVSPGYECTCPPGQADLGSGCELVDACAAGVDDCDPVATCVDTPGVSTTYACSCPSDGYSGDGRSSGSGCANIEECAANPCGIAGVGGDDGTGCVETALASWSAPGYGCFCQSGFDFDGTTCVLSNECTANLDDCDPAATCVDRSDNAGDWTCSCPAGYLGGGHGVGGCRDIDECRVGADDCATDAVCTNTDGGFSCACPPGYFGDGRLSCDEIDECMDPLIVSECDPRSTCRNLAGSYACECNEGYAGDGRVSCTDVDECAEGTSDCDPDAICTNEPGRWTCACDVGWTGDGQSCADIDECLDATIRSRCSSVAECRNLPGGWECACLSGYEGDGFTCNDTDECARGTHGCAPEADCENTSGSFTCRCPSGYRGSGFECVDIDECAESLDDCGPRQRCVNRVGMAPTCECMLGFLEVDGECVSRCGDGILGPAEACDNGEAARSDTGARLPDGCDDETCEVEFGWACFGPVGEPSTCTGRCGDGFVDATEECDDGSANADAPDACRLRCTRPRCGDGILDTAEACDDGDLANDDTAPDACRSDCMGPRCGDGVIDTGERCDPGGGAGDPTRCTAAACDPTPESDAGPGAPPSRDGSCAAHATRPRSTPWLLVGLALLARRRRQRTP